MVNKLDKQTFTSELSFTRCPIYTALCHIYATKFSKLLNDLSRGASAGVMVIKLDK